MIQAALEPSHDLSGGDTAIRTACVSLEWRYNDGADVVGYGYESVATQALLCGNASGGVRCSIGEEDNEELPYAAAVVYPRIKEDLDGRTFAVNEYVPFDIEITFPDADIEPVEGWYDPETGTTGPYE